MSTGIRFAIALCGVLCACGDNGAEEPRSSEFASIEVPKGISCSQDGDSMLVGTESHGLHRISRADRTVEEILWFADVEVPEEERGRLGINYIRAMHRGPDNKLWLGTSGDIVRYDGTWRAEGLGLTRDISDISFDGDGQLWAVSNASALGGELYRLQSGRWERVLLDGLGELAFRGVAPRPGAGLWLASTSGVVSMPSPEAPTLFDAFEGESLAARAVALDASGRVWAGLSLGAAVLDGDTWRFFGDADDPAEAIPDASINHMISARGSVWAGSAFGHVARIFEPGVAQAFEVPGLRQAIDSVEAICVTDDGELWVVSLDSGVFVLDLLAP